MCKSVQFDLEELHMYETACMSSDTSGSCEVIATFIYPIILFALFSPEVTSIRYCFLVDNTCLPFCICLVLS